MGPERRGRAVHGRLEVNPSGEEPTDRPRQKNAGLWEPYDGRLSRTVLREREGEVPSRHSPRCIPHPQTYRTGATQPRVQRPTKCTQPNTDISTYRDIPNAPSTAHIHKQINTPE